MSADRSRKPSCLFVGLLLLWLAMPATVDAANRCENGGKPRPDEGGIEGTGMLPVAPDEDDSGIGGTGITGRADAGIIGTITGFASICVGGMEIGYGAGTLVEIDGQPAAASQLAIGQVVEVLAKGEGSEFLAQNIVVRHVVTGPITQVDVEQNEIAVMGQRVRLDAGTHWGGFDEDVRATAGSFTVGSFVRVAGMRREDGAVSASRVTPIASQDLVELSGPVTEQGRGSVLVAGTEVRVGSEVNAAIADEVRVRGRWDGSALVARFIESIPTLPFNGAVSRLNIEGFPHGVAAGQMKVGSFRVELAPSVSPESLPSNSETRIWVQAVVRGDRVVAERVTAGDLPMQPPPPEARGSDGGRGLHNAPPHSNESDQAQREQAGARPEMPIQSRGSEPVRPPDAGSVLPQLPAVRPDPPQPPVIPDRPQRPDRPEIPERMPRVERPERPDRPGGQR
jgi:hypothetical protein